MAMTRRQIYLGDEETGKVRRIARQRRTTESDVIRDAIKRLPEEDDDLVRRLREAGLLVESPPPPAMTHVVRQDLQERLDAMLAGRRIGLAEALAEERDESD